MPVEDHTPRRRRRPPSVEVPPEVDVPPQEEQPTPPHRIIVERGEELPEWMVSADDVSGAASRRAMQHAPAQAESPQSAKAPHRVTKPARSAEPKAPEQPQSTPQRTPQSTPQRAPQRYTAKRTVKKSPTPPQPTPPPRKPAPRKPAPRKAAPRKLSKQARARRARNIRRACIGALAAALVVTLIVVGVMGTTRLMTIKQTLDRGDGVFYPNIFVNNIPLEGYTLDEAAAIVTRQVSDLISGWRITLRTHDGRSWDITGDDLQMRYDVADQLDQLWAIGHTGSSQERYEQVKALQEEPVLRYTTLTYDLSSVNQILTQIKAEVDRPAVSATRVDDDTRWPPFSYTDDIPGQTLDITGLNETICGMVDRLESGVVDLSPSPVQAVITREALEKQIVKLSSYETAIGNTSTEGRFANIEQGTKRFNHLIIKPGESVSFNKVAGKRTLANGYQEALEIAYGEYVMGVGGGICQVSSTLYNAVVNAGLTVVSRTQHSLPSSYVPKGLDATVQDDRLDFVFKNSTNADIYIETNYYRKKGYYYCQFTIYGRPDPNGHTYKLDSQVREVIPLPETTIVPDKNMTYVVYDDETYPYSKGEEGYIVDVYLVTMDAKGLELSRELKYTDTYKARKPVMYVGITPRETPAPEGAN